MKKAVDILMILITFLILFSHSIYAQTGDDLKAKIDGLVLKHYFDGIQYTEANALGPNAVPYLLELLNNPNIKEYWVNIIVTLGFIESSTALNPLISFLENSRGEVDISNYRALMSVPFAIGCIASNGDPKAFNYLIGKVYTPSPVRWSFRGKNINRILAEKSIRGLAISGQARARAEILKLKGEIERKKGPTEREVLIKSIKNGLDIMDRIKNKGRSTIFNPQK